MLTVTDEATKFIAGLLDEADAPDGVAARIVATQDGLQLGMDQARDEDATFEHDGRVVLIVDPQTQGILDERTLDLTQGDEGDRLALQ
jgi:Fe-S cluster assembly iron-binding protein IscA